VFTTAILTNEEEELN